MVISKAAVVKDAESAFGISIDKRLEISECDGVTDENLVDEIIKKPDQPQSSASMPSQPLTAVSSAPADLLARIARIGKHM